VIRYVTGVARAVTTTQTVSCITGIIITEGSSSGAFCGIQPIGAGVMTGIILTAPLPTRTVIVLRARVVARIIIAAPVTPASVTAGIA
jgi:hypothetical protein